MWADTEIRRDLVRGWRDEAKELWREHYSEPPEVDPDDDFDELFFDLWCRRKDATWSELAVSAMDLDLAREIDDICDRTAVEVMIQDRAGEFDPVRQMLDRARAIRDVRLKSKVIAGICFGVQTPAWALDLGLLGHALAIPDRLLEHRWAVAAVVETLGQLDLLRWVSPPYTCTVLSGIAARTADPTACRDSLERAFLESDIAQIRRSMEAIARSGDLQLNEWAMRKVFNRRSAGERALCFAILGGGPLSQWAGEFAISTCDEIDTDSLPETFGSLNRVFHVVWRRSEWGREIPLAELAITSRDPGVADRILDPEVRELTLAAVGIDQRDPEPLRRLQDPHLRAQALIEFARRQQVEEPIFEAATNLKRVYQDEDYLDTLIRLLSVFGDIRPTPSRRERAKPERKQRRRGRRRVHQDQLSLSLEI